MNYENILKQLCALHAPSGFEAKAAQAAVPLLQPWLDEVSIDRMGNVVGVRRCGKENAPKLLLDAHLDEIGFVITGHEEGFLRFDELGGVDPRVLPDRELIIMTEPPIFGVVACMPPHVQSKEDMDQSQPINELVIDVGLSQEEAQRLIPVGTPAVFRAGCMPLGNDVLCGKSLDDRSCFAILLDTVEQLKDTELDIDLYVLGSTQEETHSTGAITASYGIMADMCVAVDVTHGNSPDAPKEDTFVLGGGPVIGMGPNCTGWMTRRMIDKASELGLDVQFEVMSGNTGTNGWPMQISREGIATAILSLPLRYMHTPVEAVSRSDLADTARLLAAFIRDLGEEVPSYD